jgi:hypothetical protein
MQAAPCTALPTGTGPPKPTGTPIRRHHSTSIKQVPYIRSASSGPRGRIHIRANHDIYPWYSFVTQRIEKIKGKRVSFHPEKDKLSLYYYWIGVYLISNPTGNINQGKYLV